MMPPAEGNDRLLDDVAAATRARRGHEAPRHDERIIRSRIDGPLIDRFTAEAETAGMQVSRTSAVGLLDAIRGLVRPAGPGITLLEPALAAGCGELSALPGAITEATEDELYAATHGVVGVDAAIAETGSLVRHADGSRPRGFALVPMTVIFVVAASQIVADLYDVLPVCDPAGMPSDMVIVTGPSKTADIGMKLVTGIHGPGIVHIVLVDDA